MRSTRAFIYSLPRSGSAWLSVFLTGRDSFCFHEPTAEPLATETLFSGRPESVVCGVDTGAFLIAPHIGRELGARCYVLKRDTDDVQASLDRAGFGSFNAARHRSKLDEVCWGMPEITYERLDNWDYLKEVWDEIIGQPFDAGRARALVDMNIQRDFGKFI